jgi:hypothetical protein
MQDLIHLFQAKYAVDPKIDAAIAIDCRNLHTQLIDGFDYLFLVILDDLSSNEDITHYKQDNFHIQEIRVSRKGLQRWMLSGSNRNVMQWVLGGVLILDRQGWLAELRAEWTTFPPSLRNKKLLIEFAAFLRIHSRCQEYLCAGQMMDAYSQVNAMLHHWARIYIIEAGLHPEVMVWRQVYDINPGVYKMYQELQESTETLQQRVELVLLAIEFSIIRRMTDCSQVLLQLISSREEAWGAAELRRHPVIAELEIDLNLVLQKLISKQVLTEIAVPAAELPGIQEMKYIIK